MIVCTAARAWYRTSALACPISTITAVFAPLSSAIFLALCPPYLTKCIMSLQDTARTVGSVASVINLTRILTKSLLSEANLFPFCFQNISDLCGGDHSNLSLLTSVLYSSQVLREATCVPSAS